MDRYLWWDLSSLALQDCVVGSSRWKPSEIQLLEPRACHFVTKSEEKDTAFLSPESTYFPSFEKQNKNGSCFTSDDSSIFAVSESLENSMAN